MSLHLDPEQKSKRPRLVCRNGKFFLQIGWTEHFEPLDEDTAFAMCGDADQARHAFWTWYRFGPKDKD